MPAMSLKYMLCANYDLTESLLWACYETDVSHLQVWYDLAASPLHVLHKPCIILLRAGFNPVSCYNAGISQV